MESGVLLGPPSPTGDFNAALTSTYQKVATTTAATKSLRMSCACNATAYDIEYRRSLRLAAQLQRRRGRRCWPGRISSRHPHW